MHELCSYGSVGGMGGNAHVYPEGCEASSCLRQSVRAWIGVGFIAIRDRQKSAGRSLTSSDRAGRKIESRFHQTLKSLTD